MLSTNTIAMDIEDSYRIAYENLANVISKRVADNRLTALGYTSNLDLLCDFHINNLNELLAAHMEETDLQQMKPANSIRTMQELLSTMVYYCVRGIGGEADVENTGLLQDSFHFCCGMGGTGVQAALALSEIGCPSVVHLTDDSKEVCDMLNTPSIYTVSEDGTMVHTNAIMQKQKQELHFIIQFKKGDQICLGKQIMAIPCSNRLILTKITVNEYVPFSKPYFRWIEANATRVSSNVLSSFNALLDQQLLKQHLEEVREHIKRYRDNHPGGIVFFEDAHYHDSGVRRLCLETIYSSVDLVSLNEEELKHTLDMYGFDADVEDIISCVEGVQYLQKRFAVRMGIIVHTKDYAMYVGRPLSADIKTGLIYGNLLATAKAKNGWYGNHGQIKEVLELALSPIGLAHYQTLQSSDYADTTVLVPSKYIDSPRFTIGLGDSFVGGVQMCF